MMKTTAARMAADAYALAYIAACECPADIKGKFGRNHGSLAFAEMSWQVGFVARAGEDGASRTATEGCNGNGEFERPE